MTTLTIESEAQSEALPDAQSDAHIKLDFGKLGPDIRRELRALCKLDNYHAVFGLLFDYAVIAVSVYLCVGVSWWFYPASLILIGSTQRAFVNLLHESSHKVLAKNGKLNVLFGTVFSGYLILHLYNPYRSSHIGFHHRFLGDPEKDPDFSFHVECGIYDHTSSNRTFFLKNVLLAMLGFRTFSYVKYVVEDRLLFKAQDVAVSMPVKLRTERRALLAQWVLILGALAFLGALPEFFLLWVVPMFTSAIAVGWLSELAEHYPLPESEDRRILMTRNRHGWAIERFLLGRHHDNYHLVHHLNTGVPFWNMRKAHQVLLGDAAYARWDALWAGILTRAPGRGDQETLVSYASKYRNWRRAGGDPKELDTSFAEMLALARDASPHLAGPSRPDPVVTAR
ncbi:fatty acid desaturase [Streptomyces sp. NPDC051956]|uniref:fatty acid desaturase n=1 Tax=Streptomyces sp. NPDC051956 TaxID=3365677 RepID=UPI0037D368F3